MITLYFFMLFVFIAYVSTITYKYGILPSISESYYRLPRQQSMFFTLFCWGFALVAMILGILTVDSVLLFLAGAGIVFVGAAAAFKEPLTGKVHSYAAGIGIVLSQLAIILDFHMYHIIFSFISLGSLLLLFEIKNIIF